MRSDNLSIPRDAQGNIIQIYTTFFLHRVSSLIVVLLVIIGAYVIKTYFHIRNYDISQEKRIKHVSVVQSFIYKNSKVYNRYDPVITIFNAEQQLKSVKNRIYCKRMLSSGKSEIVHGNIMNLIEAPWQCLLTTYRLICPFHASGDGNDETVKFEIGANFIVGQKLKFHEFSLTKADNQPREFITCMSRMLAFENWALFLVQMETFRYFGGDFIVAYVECALKKVYELIKIYETNGILKIRHAYKASDNPNIQYNSDSEIEFANQLTNSHLCLYEFRESAEFIAFTDWDDVLFLKKQQIPPKFFNIFQQIFISNPSASAFSIPRFPFTNEKAFRPKSNQFSLEQLYNQVHYSLKSIPPKLIVLPTRVTGVWIHSLGFSEFSEKKLQEIKVNSTIAAFLHLKNLILDEDETEIPLDKLIYTENGSNLIVGKTLQQNMQNIFKKHNFIFNSSEYSHSQIFHKLIFKCYDSIEKKKIQNSLIFCPTHKGCIYPEQNNITVIKVSSKYKLPKKIADSFWHEREKTIFVESNNGCL